MDSLINDTELNNNSVVNSDIEYYITLFCNDHDINIKEIRPQEWTAILKYINESYIKPNKMLLIYQNTIPYKRHNFFMIDSLLDKYIYLCNMYNQSISVLGFSILSGITQDNIYQWRNDKQKHIIYINSDGSIKNYNEMLSISNDGYSSMLTITPMEIYQKLIQNIELNINDMVIDGRRRGVGPIVRFNKFYETHSPGAGDHGKQAINTNDLALQLGIDSQLLELQEKKQPAGVLPDRVPVVNRQNK